MFKLLLNDRELRELARIFVTKLEGSGRDKPFDELAMQTLAAKIDAIVDANIDALASVAAMEDDK